MVRSVPHALHTPEAGSRSSTEGISVRALASAVAGILACSAPLTASAQADSAANARSSATEEVVVFGRNDELLGAAEAATEGSVGGADLLVRPMLRVAELLEAVPGMVAAQHSGSGKANQYFLRGFNLDHGTDFTTIIDGVPWNLRSHGHGQGYLDVNGLIPEIVERVNYRKGTYRSDIGDFSMVGASFIQTIDSLDAPYMSLELGEYGWGRIAGGASGSVGDGTLTFVGQAKTYDGPWALAEDLQHTSLWAKYFKPTGFGDMAFTLSYYDGNWHPTEQIPERTIGSSVCPTAFCVIDPTATGNTERLIGTVQLSGTDWEASGYVQSYDWYMQSNPTYDFQINQFDKRTTWGGRFDKTIVETRNIEVEVGGEMRYDDIGPVGLDNTEAGNFVANVANNDIEETSYGVFLEAHMSATERLRVLAGLRADYYDFDVTAISPGSAEGSETDSRVSPKFGLAYAVNDQVELYGNWGKGFHSNDARGVVNPVDPVPGLAPGEGYELGSRFEVADFKITYAYWWLNSESELIFVGDDNSVEAKDGSRRKGYEVTLFWKPADWLGIDAVYTGSHARFKSEQDGGGFHVDGAVEHSGQIGISATRNNWEASARLRYLGPYALVPDNSQRAGGTTTFNLRGAYTQNNITYYADLLNVFDRDGKDIVYYYAANVDGFDTAVVDDDACSLWPGAGGVNCRMSRAQEPRTLRVGIKWAF